MRIIPTRTHGVIDYVTGVLLVAAPWLFGFADVVWMPHVAFGFFAIVMGLLTVKEPTRV